MLHGRLLLRPDGGLAAFSRLLQHRISTPSLLSGFEVNELTMELAGRLYERAGLFAWHETHCAIRARDVRRLVETAMFAVESMQTITGDVSQCKEVALFDPKFGQWHAVPIDGLL